MSQQVDFTAKKCRNDRFLCIDKWSPPSAGWRYTFAPETKMKKSKSGFADGRKCFESATLHISNGFEIPENMGGIPL
jgi:hypothetical protein